MWSQSKETRNRRSEKEKLAALPLKRPVDISTSNTVESLSRYLRVVALAALHCQPSREITSSCSSERQSRTKTLALNRKVRVSFRNKWISFRIESLSRKSLSRFSQNRLVLSVSKKACTSFKCVRYALTFNVWHDFNILMRKIRRW